MATNQILQITGAVLIFADASYSPGTNTTLGTRTDDIDVVDLAADAARQSVKADLGAAHAEAYSVDMTVEMATDPNAGSSMNLYWSESHSVADAVGNIGGTTGLDAAYTGYSTIVLAEALRQMKFIGAFPLGVNATADGVQIGYVGEFRPVQRWGVLVWHNNSDDAIHSDSIECAVRFTPIIPDIQAAA